MLNSSRRRHRCGRTVQEIGGAQWPHDQITAIEVEMGKLTSKVGVVFVDGSTAQVEAVKGAKPEQLSEAVSQIR